MDDAQKNNNNLAEDTDLAKQYQEILDQYSQELQAKTDSTPAPEPAPMETPIPAATETLVALPPSEPAPTPINSSPRVSDPIATPQPVTEDVMDSEVTTTTTPVDVAPAPSNFFKYFFYLSLFIFLGVAGTLAYSFIQVNSQPVSQNNSESPTSAPGTNNITNVIVKPSYCQTNDKNIPVGESFPALDDCNTCTCTSDKTINCTQNSCEASATSKTATPTQKPTVLNLILKNINSKLKTNYVESTLDKGQKWSVNLTNSSSSSDILIIKRAIIDFGLALQPKQNANSGNDWKEVYARNADTCSLEYFQKILTLSCYNQ